MKLRELVVTLGFDIDLKKLDNIEKAVEELKTNLQGVAIVAASAAAALFGFAKVTADSANNIRNTAAQLGVGTKDLQALGFAAEKNGATFEDMVGGLQSLTQAMNAARLGSGNQADAFRRLGITFKDNQGVLLPVVEVYQQLADRMSKMDDGTKKVAIASDILGGSAGKLLQTLSQGATAAGVAGRELESMGGILSETDFLIAKQFQSTLTVFTTQLSAIGKKIGFAIIPQVSKAIGMFQKWMSVNQNLIRVKISEFLNVLGVVLNKIFRISRSVLEVITGLYKGLEFLLKPVGGVAQAFKVLAYGLALFVAGRTLIALGTIAQTVFNIGKAFTLVNAKALLVPMLIAAVAAAIYLIVDDIVAYVEGRPSFLGWLLRNKDKILKDLDVFFTRVRKSIFDFVEKILVKFFEFFDVPTKQAKQAAAKIRGIFENLFDVLKSLMTNPFVILMTVLEQGTRLIVDLFTKPMETFEQLGSRIAMIFGETLKSAMYGMADLGQTIGKLFGVNPETIKRLWTTFLDVGFLVIGKLQTALQFIFEGLGTFIGAILDKVITAIDFVVKTFGAIIRTIAPFLADPKGTVGGVFNKAKDALTNNVVADEIASLFNFSKSLLPGGDTPQQITGKANSATGTTTTNTQAPINYSPTINVNAPTNGSLKDFETSVKKALDDSFKQQLRQTNSILTPQVKY